MRNVTTQQAPYSSRHTPKTRYSSLLVLLCCLVMSFSSLPSYAEISRGQAAAQAKAMHGGKVLNVNKTTTKNGDTVYRVRLLLKGGRVKTVTIRSK